MQLSLKAARVNAGLTQKDVETELGYSRSTLTRWETGKTMPRADTLKALCNLYHVSLEDIHLEKKERSAATPRSPA